MPRRARQVRRALLAVLVVVLGGAARAAAAGEAEGIDPGDIGQAVMTLLVFAVLLLILRKWAWRPIVNQIRTREEAIAKAIEEARKREQDAQDLLAHHRARLEAAEHEAQQVLAEARAEAAASREEVLAAARSEARKATEDAKAEVEEAKRVALGELHDATADLAVEVAAAILRRRIAPEDSDRLFDESVDEIRKRMSGDA